MVFLNDKIATWHWFLTHRVTKVADIQFWYYIVLQSISYNWNTPKCCKYSTGKLFIDSVCFNFETSNIYGQISWANWSSLGAWSMCKNRTSAALVLAGKPPWRRRCPRQQRHLLLSPTVPIACLISSSWAVSRQAESNVDVTRRGAMYQSRVDVTHAEWLKLLATLKIVLAHVRRERSEVWELR